MAHFAYLLLVVGGGFLAWRWPRALGAHLLATGAGVVIVVASLDCPLTYAEDRLRRRAGQPGLPRGFVDTYIEGCSKPLPLPAPAANTTVDDYRITVDGQLTAGRTSRLTLNVAKYSVPVTDLQPYLGAYGHLVALRAGDLGYLHVHPQQTDAAGPAITFDVEVPTTGAYRLFLDFQHDGVVRTASFTTEAL